MDKVLFEYEGARAELNVTNDNILEEIEKELDKYKPGARVVFCDSDVSQLEHSDVFILQVWSGLWKRFVNVSSTDKAVAGALVCVCKRPSHLPSPKQVSGSEPSCSYSPGQSSKFAQSIAKQLSKPSEVEANKLASLFPSYKKKISGIQPGIQPRLKGNARKAKLCMLTVVMLKKFASQIPKGQVRQRLAKSGKIQTIRVHRDMPESQLREKISSVFKCASDFTVLGVDGSNLCKQSEQAIDGSAVLEHKCLYACETFEDDVEDDVVITLCDKPSKSNGKRLIDEVYNEMDDFLPSTRPSKPKKKVVKIDFESSDSSGLEELETDKMAVLSDKDKELEARRSLIREQDREYNLSLEADRAKDERKNTLKMIQDRLALKWANVESNGPGRQFILCLPSGGQLKAIIPSYSLAMALYEIVFALGGVMVEFKLYTRMPRQCVPKNVEVFNLPRVLLVESSSQPIDVSFFEAESPTDGTVIGEKDENVSSKPDIIHEVDAERLKFVKANPGKHRQISRCDVYSDVIEVYCETTEEILDEFPVHFKFKDERAYDAGGVCREVFSCFWKAAYPMHFDGERLLVPSVRPGMERAKLQTLGMILSHGYLVSGFLPIRVAFPILACTVLGPDIFIPDEIILECFVDYICTYESSLLRGCLQNQEPLTRQLTALLSRFDCTAVPTKKNLRKLVIDVARHVFLGKPLGLVYSMSSGVPKCHHAFWSQLTVHKLYELYKALNATPQSVLNLIEEPEFENKAESNVYYYFTSFIGNCQSGELRSLLRFITGSSVIIDREIKVSFNSLSGLCKRPISHTCDCVIELPTTYDTYVEFEEAFKCILANEDSWMMDAI